MSTQDDQSDQGEAAGTEQPEVDEETKQKAKEMMEYRDDRPTAVLPDTGGTVTGTAINDWLDDEGNVKDEGEGDDEGNGDDEGDED